MIKLDFAEYLLTENKNYLGEKIGDVLAALQDLAQNGKVMGTRQLIRATEGICNQMRKILHSNWQQSNKKYLPTVQKVAVALMKAAKEKDDLANVIDGAVSELENLLEKMKIPINTLATTVATSPAEPATTAPPQPQPDPAAQQAQRMPDPNAQVAPPYPKATGSVSPPGQLTPGQ